MAANLLPSIADDRERSILQQVAARLGDIDPLYVGSLGRFGFSGARLFRCHAQGGRVFVVKMHSEDKIQSEARALLEIEPYFKTGIASHDPISVDGRAALVYDHAANGGITEAERVAELHDWAFREQDHDNIALRVMRSLYARLVSNLDARSCAESRCLKDEYASYITPEILEASKRVFTSVYGAQANKPQLRFLGARIVNPMFFIRDKRFSRPATIVVGPVHGDLHPKNVMFGDDGVGRLIDFAWARRRGHLLVDFVLMECSLRFMMFPRYVNLETHSRVDDALMSQDGYKSARGIVRRTKLEFYYKRLFAMLEVIRTACVTKGCPGGFDDYLAAQFLIMLRQITYPGYQTPSTFRAVGMLAKYLEAKWQT